MGFPQAADPLHGGGGHDAVTGLAGSDADGCGQMRLAGPGRTEEHHVALVRDEVECGEVVDRLAAD